MTQDRMGEILEQWARARPDIDASPMALFGRLGQAGGLGLQRVEEGLAPFKLSVGEFDVLATLRRSGPPFELMPSALASQLLLSPAAITNRVDRLLARGLVGRRGHANDRRVVFVRLTPAGLELVDRAVEAHLANEQRLIANALTDDEAERLNGLLAKLLRAWQEPLAR